MAKKTVIENSGRKTGKSRPEADDAADPGDDNWADNGDAGEYDERWLHITAREKEKSRIQRQMKARRELERLRDEKQLQLQVADWSFED